MTVQWLAELCESEQVLYRLGREGDVRVAEWPGLLRMHHAPDGTVQFTELTTTQPARVAKVKNGIARALVRSLSGGLTLHASAVTSQGRAIVCMGASGQGKSTLAAALCARPGVQLLADDMAPIDETLARHDAEPEFVAAPSEQAVWLSSAEAEDKSPRPLNAARESSSIVALIALGFHDAEGADGADPAARPTLRPMTAVETFTRLIPSVVRFAVDDPRSHERELGAIGRLSRGLHGFELLRPRDLSQLEHGVSLLAALLHGEYSATS